MVILIAATQSWLIRPDQKDVEPDLLEEVRVSDTGSRAKGYFLERVWAAYADFYDAYRVDSGDAQMRIRSWSELSPALRAHFETELSKLNGDIMNLVQAIGLDDADG